MAQPVRFIRKNGKVIPIRVPSGLGKVGKGIRVAGAAIGVAGATAHYYDKRKKQNDIHAAAATAIEKPPIKPRFGLKWGSIGLSAAEGIISGLGIGAGRKTFLASQGASVGLEATTLGMAGAAYAGKDRKVDRLKAAAKLEGVNQAVGWGLFGATALGRKAGRRAIVHFAEDILIFARKALRVA